jgi:hypothetical protein
MSQGALQFHASLNLEQCHVYCESTHWMYWVHPGLQEYRLNTAGTWIINKIAIFFFFLFINMLQNHNG